MYYSSSIRSPDPYLYSKRDGKSRLLSLSVTTLQSIDEEVRKKEEVVILSASHNYLHHTVVWGWRDAVD